MAGARINGVALQLQFLVHQAGQPKLWRELRHAGVPVNARPRDGITLWEIFSFGMTPYPHMNNTDVREKITAVNATTKYRMEKPTEMPDNIYNDITKRCWEQHPADRPTFKYIYMVMQDLSDQYDNQG